MAIRIPSMLRQAAGPRSSLPAALVAVVIAAACSTATPELEQGAPPTPTAEPTSTAEPDPTPTPAGDTSDDDDAVAEVLDATPGATGVGDPYYPTLGNGGYDVQRYVLDLEWSPDDQWLRGTATLEMVATQDLSAFTVELFEMQVDAITVDGVEAAFTRDANEITVELPDAVPADEPFDAVFAYQGRPTSIPPLSNIDVGGWFTTDTGAYVVGQPSSAEGWHPVNDHPLDRARFRIEMTVPASLEVAANGRLVDTIDEGDGRTTHVFETADEQLPYLTTIAIGDLVRVDGGEVEFADGRTVPIRNWFVADRVDQADRFDRTPEMLRVFDEMFGPYPFEAYGVLVVDDFLGVALETQTLSIFGDDFLQRSGSIDGVVAHELAHQWFGNHVALAEWDDIWLNEGFATYAEHLWFEASDPNYDIDAAMVGIAGFDPQFLSVPVPGDPGPDRLFAPSVYFRGALTLHALRRTVGDDVFFATLRAYFARFAGDNVVTADFQSVAESESGLDLDDFFRSWLLETDLPPLPTS